MESNIRFVLCLAVISSIYQGVYCQGVIESSLSVEPTLPTSLETSSNSLAKSTTSFGSTVETTPFFSSSTQSDSLQRTDITPSTPAEPSLIPTTVTSSQPSPTSTRGVTGIGSPAESMVPISVELSSFSSVDTTNSLGSIVGTTSFFSSGTQSDSLQRTDITPSTPAEPSLIPAATTNSPPSPTSTAVLPIIIGRLESTELLNGSNHTFVCAAHADPLPNFEWRFNGDSIQQDTLKYSISSNTTHSSLTVYNLMVSDDGGYSCLASNRYGTDSTSANVTVLLLPQLTEFPELFNYVPLGDNLTVSCTAEGRPTPNITWEKNDSSLMSSEIANIFITFSEGKSELIITDFTNSSNGIYSCIATNDVGTDAWIFQVETIIQPDITVQLESVKIVNGSNHTFVCAANADPLPTFEWRFNRDRIQQDITKYSISSNTTHSSLTVYNLMVGDDGGYICLATNRFGTDSTSANITVLFPPRLIEFPAPFYSVVLGENLMITCSAEGRPTPEITWRRMNTLLNSPQSENNIFINSSSEGRSELRIINLTRSGGGQYSCTATNEVGNDTRSFEVKALGLLIPDGDLTLDCGDQQSFMCIVASVAAGWTIYGLSGISVIAHSGLSAATNNLRISTNHTIGITPSSIITINGFTTSDNGGIIQCIDLNENSVQGMITISLGIPSCLTRAAAITNDENDAITVTWLQSNDTLPVIFTTVTYCRTSSPNCGDSLTCTSPCTISGLDPGTEYQFTVIPNNNCGSPTGCTENVATVETLSTPVIVPVGGNALSVSVGEDVSLHFDIVRANPPVLKDNITWVISTSSGQKTLKCGNITRYIFSDDCLSLHITNTQRTDRGSYTVIAVNRIGTGSNAISISVSGVEPIITTHLESTTLVVGSNHTFVCAALGDPPPTFGWRFNGDRIPQDTSKYSITSNRTHTLLTVYNLMVSDDGGYICQASNRYGTASTSANITVLFRSQLTEFPRGVRSVVLGEDLVVSCTAEGRPTPEIVWSRNNIHLNSLESMNILISYTSMRSELQITSFTHTNSGEYSCTASNGVGNDTRYFEVNIIVRPTITGINIRADSAPISSISHSGNISFEEFSTNIIFTCTANGMPLPEIEWLFDGTVLSSNNRIAIDSKMVPSEDESGGFSDSTLTISTLQLSDRGMYTCRAISGNVSPIPGQSAVTFELVVSARNECMSNPCQNDGECIDGIGDYSCICIQNILVVYSGKNCTEVIDLSSPPTITNQPRGRNDRLFDKVTLMCSADGNPDPVIRWYKDGVALEGPQSVGGVYTIDRIKPEDRGTYHCQATNTRGTAISAMVKVLIQGIVQFTMDIIDRESGKELQAVNIQLTFEELSLLAVGQKIGGTGNVSAEIVSLVQVEGSNAVIVTVNTNSTQPPAVLTEILTEPITAQFAEYSDIIQNISFMVQRTERFDGCPVEVTTDCSNIANIIWGETEIGDEASVRCPCGPEDENPLPPQSVATRRCVGDYENGARWEDPKCAECQFSASRLDLCELLEVDSAAQVAVMLANVTKVADNIQSEDVAIASSLLDRVANSTDIQADMEVLDDFFSTVDNIVDVDDSELRASNEDTGSVNRITESLDRVVDAIPLPENDTSGNASIMLSFRNFGIQIQQLPQDNISFTPDLTSLIENIGSTNKMVSNNEDTISSVTLPPELSSTSPSVVLAVFLRTSLFPPNNSNSSVGSVVISVSTPNQTVQNLAEPVIFKFGKNEVVKSTMDSGAPSNLSCTFWDNLINEGRGDWSSRGCVVVNETADEVTCQCDHLTSFSILLDVLPAEPPTKPMPVDTILTIVSYIGCGLSVIALVIALVTYLAEKNLHTKLHQKLLISLMFALLGLYVTFIITNAVSSYQNHLRTIPVICGILSALLHYFFIVTFLCMAAIAINLYRALVVVFNAEIKDYLPMAVSISWIVPVFIVGFSIAPNYKYYTGEIIPYCRAQAWPFYFGLILPFGLIYIFNMIMFIIIIVNLIRRPNVQKEAAKGGNLKKVKENFWVTVGLSVLFGVSWVFGLLATAGLPNYIRLPFDIVFTVLSSFQGVFVFLLNCVKSQECRQLWNNWLHCRFTKSSQSKVLTTGAPHTSTSSGAQTGRFSRLGSTVATLNRFVINPFNRHNYNVTHTSASFSDSAHPPPSESMPPIELVHVGEKLEEENKDNEYTETISFHDEYSMSSYYTGAGSEEPETKDDGSVLSYYVSLPQREGGSNDKCGVIMNKGIDIRDQENYENCVSVQASPKIEN